MSRKIIPLRREESGPSDGSGSPQSNTDAPAPVPGANVTISTSSVFAKGVEDAFWIARRLKATQRVNIAGVEILPIFPDRASQESDRLRELSVEYDVPIRSIHVPCLGPETIGVWGWKPWEKVDRSIQAARELGAEVVVVHPPFWWQRSYADEFIAGIAERQAAAGDIRIAVENMYPRKVLRCRPHWLVTDTRWTTLDVSHAAASGLPLLTVAEMMGGKLAHVHLSDSVIGKDQHKVPGQGTQKLRELFHRLAESGYGGHLCLEVNTFGAITRAEKYDLLEEACHFIWENWPRASALPALAEKRES